MKTPEEEIRQIIENHKLTFFYPYPSKHIALITEIAVAYHAKFEPASIQSLIERVENEAYDVTTQSGDGLIIVELDDVLNILKSTPCIPAKALRNKTTGEIWVYGPGDIKTFRDMEEIEIEILLT